MREEEGGSERVRHNDNDERRLVGREEDFIKTTLSLEFPYDWEVWEVDGKSASQIEWKWWQWFED
jgi:hypothetical protein